MPNGAFLQPKSNTCPPRIPRGPVSKLNHPTTRQLAQHTYHNFHRGMRHARVYRDVVPERGRTGEMLCWKTSLDTAQSLVQLDQHRSTQDSRGSGVYSRIRLKLQTLSLALLHTRARTYTNNPFDSFPWCLPFCTEPNKNPGAGTRGTQPNRCVCVRVWAP